ncbi:MAG TPA: amidohydrolase family protein [Thermomicrobiales bacterium]|jgi:predicted TIM-barrel fold metal-dependent hydrolase
MPTMDFEAYLPTEVDAEARRAALAELASWEEKAGIAMAVVMPVPTPRPDNQALLETLAGDPRWVPCCQVNPQHDDAVAQVRVAAAAGCRMLKLMPAIYNAPPASAISRALIDVARETGMIVNIHSVGNNSHPLEIGAVAHRYPDVIFIMDHMGYRTEGYTAILAAQDNPNLYLGTTIAAVEPSFIATAIAEVGAERVIFGSNYPNVYPDLMVESLRRAKFGQEVEELILGGNLSRLLGIAD